jgi:prepilin-type N-terminal cleavage/methylation domain-containing protein
MKPPEFYKNKLPQSGISLIEVLIALALSSLLMSAAFSIVADSSQSLNTQKGLNQINETSRFALETIAREIRKAGYRDNVLLDHSLVYPEDNDLQFDAGQSISGNAQSLTLRYQGSGNPADGRVLDCLGNSVSNNEIVVVQLKISNGNFVCERLGPKSTGTQIIGAHVSNIQFQYGIDTNNDSQIDQYRNDVAKGVTALSIQNTLTALDEAALDSSGKAKTNLIQKSFSQLISVRNNS